MKRVAVVLLLAAVVCGCGKKQHEIVYEGKIEPGTTLRPVAETLNDTFVFSWPRDIVVMDSLLIVNDSYKQANCFHIFHKGSGAHIKSFGKKGRGAGELIEVNSFNANHDGRSITAFDPNSRKVVVFDIGNVLNGVRPYFREYVVDNAPNFVKQVIPCTDYFIAKGNDDKMRYGIWSPENGAFSGIYTDYPGLALDPEDNWSLTDHSVRVRVSPDGRRLVAATYIGGVLEMFYADGDGFAPGAIRYFYEPHYGYAEGAQPRWATTVPQTIIGFEDLCLTKDAVYGLIWGTEKAAMSESVPCVVKFDYDGNPLCRYEFDFTHESFAVDGDSIAYGIGFGADGVHVLNKYVLP